MYSTSVLIQSERGASPTSNRVRAALRSRSATERFSRATSATVSAAITSKKVVLTLRVRSITSRSKICSFPANSHEAFRFLNNHCPKISSSCFSSMACSRSALPSSRFASRPGFGKAPWLLTRARDATTSCFAARRVGNRSRAILRASSSVRGNSWPVATHEEETIRSRVAAATRYRKARRAPLPLPGLVHVAVLMPTRGGAETRPLPHRQTRGTIRGGGRRATGPAGSG